MPGFSPHDWLLVTLAAFFAGVSKAGLSGVGLLGVTLMAAAIPGRASSGVVLPMLILADVVAASTFRTHVRWVQLRRLGLPVAAGIVAGWLLLMAMPDGLFRPVIGGLVLGMLALQFARQHVPWFDAHLPHSTGFAWLSGVLTGVSTMVANAAGPIASLYLIILSFGKREFVHTLAWLFLFVNLFKVPFSVQLGLINAGSLTLNLYLAPAVLLGLWAGKHVVERVSQAVFQNIILVFSAISAVWLLFR